MNKPRVFAADILRILDALPESEQIAACRAAGFEPSETAAETPAPNKLDPQQRPPDGFRLAEQSARDNAYMADAAAFDAELKSVAMIRRQHGDHAAAFAIEQAIIRGETNEWTEKIAKRFIHVLS